MPTQEEIDNERKLKEPKITAPWDKSNSQSTLPVALDKSGFGKTVAGNIVKNALTSGGVVDVIEKKMKGWDPSVIGKANTDKLDESASENATTQGSFAAAIQQAQNRQGPGQVQAQTVDRSGIQNVNAPIISGAPQVQSERVGATSIANNIQQITAPNIGPASFAEAVSARNFDASAQNAAAVNGSASSAMAAQAASGQVGNSQTLESRNAQGEAANLVRNAALGNAPSAAQLQMNRGFEQAIKSQLAVLASQKGGYNAAAIRQAQNNTAELQQQSNEQSAVLRAQEMAQARGQFVDATGQMRNADGTLAVNQAQMDTQVSTANAGLTTDVARQNAQLATQASLQNASNQTDVSKANAQMGTQVAMQNAQNAGQNSQFNAAQSGEISRFNVGQANQLATNQAQLGLSAAQSNQSASLTGLTADQDNALRAAQANQSTNLSAQQSNQNAAVQTSLANAEMNMKSQLANQGVDLDVLKQNAASGNQVALANMEAALRQQGLNDDMVKTYLSGIVNLQGQNSASNLERYKVEQQRETDKSKAKSNVLGSTIGAIASVFAKSDKNAKKNIKPASGEVKSFLDALKAYHFEYKDSKDGEGKHTGIMAQDAEKSKMGKEMVVDTPDGKVLDMRKGFGMVLAAQAELNKRLAALEKKRK